MTENLNEPREIWGIIEVGAEVGLATASLTSPDGKTWTLSNLSGLTNTAGSVRLDVAGDGIGHQGPGGNLRRMRHKKLDDASNRPRSEYDPCRLSLVSTRGKQVAGRSSQLDWNIQFAR